MAGLLALACWSAGLFSPFEAAFNYFPDTLPLRRLTLSFPAVAILTTTMSVGAGVLVDRLGARGAFPLLGGAFVALTLMSVVASHFFLLDILVSPVAIGLIASAALVQISRLCMKDNLLRRELVHTAQRFLPRTNDETTSRLSGALKLLDVLLSVDEAIVFGRDAEGQLEFLTRLRASDSSAITSRNSVWREGIELCRRAIKRNQSVDVESAAADTPGSIAIPLTHGNLTLGALLIRHKRTLEDHEQTLLKAIASQIARDLQRDAARKEILRSNPVDFFSTRGATRKLHSLHVLSGHMSEQLFGTLALAEVSDGVAIVHLDGTIAFINPTLLRFARITSTEAAKLNLFDLLDCFRTDVFDEPRIAVRRVMLTGDPYERDLSFADRSETFSLGISLVCSKRPGSLKQPLCLAINVRDVTRVKEYQQLKSDMISLMSHELRTPLTSINGFAELLSTDNDIPDHAKEFVEIIANESQRLSRMINTFLAVTQLERKDKQEVLKIPLKVNDVVRETVMNLQSEAKKKRIRLVERPAQRLPPVAADKSLVTQAVRNLVSNAIKYSPERTSVTVSTALEAETVRVSVEDRGFGIPPEAVDRVWEKFYRVVREGQEKDEESTGLGLSFVREVVEQHGGTVEVESEVGKGSKFSFTLPRL